MSSEVTTTQNAEVLSARMHEAYLLHTQIKQDAEQTASSFVSFCKNLKTMKDKKLYVEFGYEEFEEYTVQMLNLKQRQAYNYIRVYETIPNDVLQSNAKLGISKLELLTQVSSKNRDKLLEEEDIEDITTAELKSRIAELEEQLSFFENESRSSENESTDSENDSDNLETISRLQSELEKEKQQKEVEIAKAQKEAEKATKKEIANIKKTAEAEAVAKVKKEIEAEVQQEKDKLIEEIKEKEQKLVELIKYKVQAEAAEAEKQRLEKQIKLSSDPALAKFKFIFETFQAVAQDCLDSYNTLNDIIKPKMHAAITALLENIKKEIAINE